MVNYKLVIALLLAIIVKAESATCKSKSHLNVEDFPEDYMDDNEDAAALARGPVTQIPNRNVHVCNSAGGSTINCNLVATVPFIFDLLSVIWQLNQVSYYYCGIGSGVNPHFVCNGVVVNPTPSPLYRSYRVTFPNNNVYQCQNLMSTNQLDCTLMP
jgi:hypothetical protein